MKGGSLLLLLGSLLATSPAWSSAPPAARLACRPAANAGRVLCEIEIEVASGRLAWVDALVRRSPAFARPLRARVGMRQATARSDRRVRLPIVLVAADVGKGELDVQARYVACEAKLCASGVQDAKAVVQVGPVRQAP